MQHLYNVASTLMIPLFSYENAAYCYEELILASPNNYHIYVRYAEVRHARPILEAMRVAL